MTKHHVELLRQLDKRGIAPASVEYRRKSIAYTLVRGPHTVKYYTGCTPSDNRALMNAVTDIERLFRAKEST